jgi:hypothetical protein
VTANIAGYTYNIADAQGKTVYTAYERAVAQAYGGSDILPGSYTKVLVYSSAPLAGIFRYGISTGSRVLRLYVNDVKVLETYGTHSWEIDARAYNIAQGDKVELACSHYYTGSWNLLPFNYPI